MRKGVFVGYKIDTISPYYNINRLNLRNLNYHSAGYSGGLSGPWQDWPTGFPAQYVGEARPYREECRRHLFQDCEVHQ